jgi:hypothetical protein
VIGGAVARAQAWLLSFALLGPALPAQKASDLVIAKEGTREYHRPGCDVIKDGKGVLALTIAQANGRGLKPHPACHDDEADGARGTAAVPPVYVDGSRYYHRKDCKKLGGAPKKIDLEVAGKTFWPCPACKPPIRKRKGRSAPL